MMSGLFGNSKSSAPAPVNASPLAPLTQDDVKRALPVTLRASVTQGLVDTLNNIVTDPELAENIRSNFVSYSSILKEGKFKTEDYIYAVAYVSYKLMGYTNEESYQRAFPQRYSSLLSRGMTRKDISAYVSAYAKGKLVNLILEQSLVPSWVLNQDIYQKAINVQAELMVSANSEKVRTDAANSLLTHLKKPESNKGVISLDLQDSVGMKELKNMLTDLANNQQAAIASGSMKTIDVAAQRIVDVEGASDVE